MKKKLNIDKFFTANLEGYQTEASLGLWNEIENDFLNSYLERDSFFKRVWPLVAIFTAGILSLAIVLSSDLNSDIYPSQLSEAISNIKETSSSNTETGITSDNNNIPDQEAATSTNTIKTEPSNNTSETITTDQVVLDDKKDYDDSGVDFTSTENVEIKDKTEYNSPYLLSIGNFLYFETFFSAVENIDYIEIVNPQPITNVNDYYRKSEFLLGAHITPSVTYYPTGENKNSYAFELTADYQKSDFFVQSGVGAEYYSEKGNYSINFESFDSVGYYYDVTSFNIDPNNPDSIIFNLKSTDIYDSVKHIKIEETSNNYLYMQVPLNVGYKVWENNRFSIKIRGGLIFSWLVYKDEPVVTYHANDITIIDINNNYPGRRKFNWQWMAGVGLNVSLSKNLTFSVEPVYKQYINSIYTKGSGMDKKLPYSVGLRTGIYLNF